MSRIDYFDLEMLNGPDWPIIGPESDGPNLEPVQTAPNPVPAVLSGFG